MENHARVEWMLQLRVYIILGSMFYLVQLVDSINHSDDITSFLFRYPISKLTPSEAAQIEILLTTLHTQKPILKASGIFTIGTRLMASITGTVITYVLVALQFHASWNQDQ
ncbi:uncharacterized protein [Atheta coriaria]|uniref:uncharacterized protein n=1 Tax=Dalotia coriaria TaxID=877792 RepID=UPI0031F3EB6A